MRLVKYFAWLIFVLIITGCATQRAVPDSDTLFGPGEHWFARGRIGITGVAQSGSASFDWSQRSDTSSVQLRGPIGIGSLSIVVDDTVHIMAANGVRYDAAEAVAELESRLGVVVPVKQMRYWLRGLAAPGTSQWQPQDTNSQHATLDQDGWHIEFELGLQQVGAQQIQLPQKIVMSHDQIRIKVVVQGWGYSEPYS